MNRAIFEAAVLLWAAAPAATAAAHPGHGSTDAGSLLHYLAEPAHLLVALAALATAALLERVASRRRRTQRADRR